MGDIRIVWDHTNGSGDFAMGANGDLLTGDDLETAILISLFSDAQADPGDVVYDPDPRGVWFDTYSALEDPTLPIINGDRTGSKLWQIFNMPRTQQTLNWMTNVIEVALNWMLIDGVADSVAAQSRFTNSGGVGAVITITKNGVQTIYDYAWGQLA